MSTTNNERAEFEAWASVPPREFDLRVFNKNDLWPGQYRMYETQCAWEGYQAGRAVQLYDGPPAPTEQWVSVEERLPNAGVPVLAFFRNSHGHGRTVRAHHAPLHTIDASHWEDGDPDETENGCFEPEGWWEDPVEIDRMEHISCEVTHWMPLPAPPDTAAKGDAND